MDGLQPLPSSGKRAPSFWPHYQIGERNGHIILKQYVFYAENESIRYALGPTLYLRIIDAFHIQAQTRHDLFLEMRTPSENENTPTGWVSPSSIEEAITPSSTARSNAGLGESK